MNIVMMTNTYLPQVGGVARSVAAFAAEYRRRGHRVLVVAPEYEDQPVREVDVLRIPAIQHFNGSDFSAVLPFSGLLTEELDAFRPDIVHAHHPYLLGMTALRTARYRGLPLVFTHHTLYEQYTHYVPGDSPVFRRFVIELAVRYANLCDQVFAPSESIAALLAERGVHTPIRVVPTGVDRTLFAPGDGAAFRRERGIPEDAYVVGHLGRLAPEKNLEFLARAVARFLGAEPRARFLLVGAGPSQSVVQAVCEQAGLAERLHLAGILRPPELVAAYHAMDVFAFASKSETQGMVLTEAMAAGVPVVGLDAPGVREVVEDGQNGRLLHEETVESFAAALQWAASLPPHDRRRLGEGALRTAEAFSMPRTADRALGCYTALTGQARSARGEEDEQWQRVRELLQAEWEIVKGFSSAAGAALAHVPLRAEAGHGGRRRGRRPLDRRHPRRAVRGGGGAAARGGLEGAGDGLPDRWMAANDGALGAVANNWNNVVAVRVGLLLRSLRVQAGERDAPPAIADPVCGNQRNVNGTCVNHGSQDPNDDFVDGVRRRVVTTTVFLRNDLQ